MNLRILTIGFLIICFTGFAQDDSTMIRKIANDVLTNGHAYENLRVLCKTVGPRLAGSKNMYKAESWGENALKTAGANKVWLQECKVPHWSRGGKDEAYAVEKYEHAASLYYEERRFMQARGVYEHLLTINPEHHEARAYVLAIAIILDWHELFIEHSEQLSAWYGQQSLSATDMKDIIHFLLDTYDQLPSSINRSLTRDVIVDACKVR